MSSLLWRPLRQVLRTSQASAHLRRAAYSQAPQPQLTEGEATIVEKLTAKFQPSQLQVQDVSGGCGSFYAITISSKAFTGLPIVKQHRLVNDTLKEVISGIHGLQLKTIPES